MEGVVGKVNLQDGTLLWMRMVVGTNTDVFYGVTNLRNGNILLTGYMTSLGSPSNSILLSEISPTGSH